MKFDSNGWLDEAEEIACLENSSSRNGRKIKYVTQHGTAGGSSAQNIARYFQSTVGSNNPASTHFVVGKDGHVVQCVPLSLAAWGNGLMTSGHAAFLPEGVNPNEYTASIEYVKNNVDEKGVPDNSDQLTEAQRLAGFRLTACICDTYGIPKRAGDASGGILGHFHIDPINRARCPGPWPWQGLFAYLSGQSQEEPPMEITLATPGVSQFFEGDGNLIWKCKKNGFLVGHAGLSFYRTFGNSALCGLTFLGLPLTDAAGVAGKPGVVYQRFERGCLCYDPQHILDNPPGSGSVYLAHINSGIGQDPRVATLQRQVDNLIDENADLQEKLISGKIITQEILDDISIIDGNVEKLKIDAGLAVK